MDTDGQVFGADIRASEGGGVVDGGQAIDKLPDRIREPLIGEVLIRPERVAAPVGADDHAEDRGHGWRRAERDVGMPGIGPGALVAVEHHDLGELVGDLGNEGMDLDLAETA